MVNEINSAESMLMQPTIFSFTDAEFIQIVNRICEQEVTPGKPYVPVLNIEDELATERLDSLGIIIFFTWMTELFGIPEELVNVFMTRKASTVHDLKLFVKSNSTKTYSYSAAEEYLQSCL